jgi:hypothetical protein
MEDRMRLAETPNDQIVLILGAPRSGTSWLGKAFDSHPDVLLRHEPDTVLRESRLPRICAPDAIATHRDLARDYLRRLIDVRTLKTSGQLPLFRKSYQHRSARHARTGLVLGLRVAEKLLGLGASLRDITIPDAIASGVDTPIHVVVKSVSALGRARLFAEALPGIRIVHMIRSPFGQVASVLRGIRENRFDDPAKLPEILQTRLAGAYGLTEENLTAMPIAQQLAWRWSILNQLALEDLAEIPNVHVIRYMDMVLDPQAEARRVFAGCGLDFHPQTARFLRRSTSFAGPDLYYQVYKNGIDPLFKWQQELAKDDIARILGVVKSTAMSKFYPELDGWAAAA